MLPEPNPSRRIAAMTRTGESQRAGELRRAGSAEAAMGFRFRPGDKVIDLVTGLGGVVDAGRSESTTVPVTRPHLD